MPSVAPSPSHPHGWETSGKAAERIKEEVRLFELAAQHAPAKVRSLSFIAYERKPNVARAHVDVAYSCAVMCAGVGVLHHVAWRGQQGSSAGERVRGHGTGEGESGKL